MKQPTIIRDVRRVIAPASIRCVLCKLYASSPPGVVRFEVRYNGKGLMPENPLCALTRCKYVCDACIEVIRTLRAAKETHA